MLWAPRRRPGLEGSPLAQLCCVLLPVSTHVSSHHVNRAIVLPPHPANLQGLVFAVGAERGVVKLYDARNWAAGPFTSFPVSGQCRFSGLAGWPACVCACAGCISVPEEGEQWSSLQAGPACR